MERSATPALIAAPTGGLPPAICLIPVPPVSVRPKKHLGQHFLADDGVVRQIVAAAGDPPGGVVEIGPGEGALTGALAARFPALVALEVDPEAVAHVRRRWPALDVRQADVLGADWRALAGELGAPLTVVGNLPYYITSPIVLALLDARGAVGRAVVMVQKEVAERLTAPPGSKLYGTLSVYVALTAAAEWVCTVPPGAFRPPPQVESAVVALAFDGREPGVPWAHLQAVVRAAFGQRRKMLRNSLGPLAERTGRAVPAWAATRRPEAVAPADFVALARHFLGPDGSGEALA